jgi:bile acid:Na+ symporter, BASS family
MDSNIDNITLNFSRGSLLFLNIILGLIMFGVALDLKPGHFRLLLLKPKSPIVGMLSQFILLPLFTYLLILLIKPHPSLALGMILVAACPGGNISNFLSSMAKGNTALSISLTGFSTLTAVILTPFNFTLYSRLFLGHSAGYSSFSINPAEMFFNVLLLLAIPTIGGIMFSNKLPAVTEKIRRPFRYLSLIFFGLFVILALLNNYDNFLKHIQLIFILVLLHNSLALITGYFTARAFNLPVVDRRTIAIETGIQNSGLGLILIFNFFNGLGGMAIVAAWWGIWHIISGMFISYYWSRNQPAVGVQI